MISKIQGSSINFKALELRASSGISHKNELRKIRNLGLLDEFEKRCDELNQEAGDRRVAITFKRGPNNTTTLHCWIHGNDKSGSGLGTEANLTNKQGAATMKVLFDKMIRNVKDLNEKGTVPQECRHRVSEEDSSIIRMMAKYMLPYTLNR